LPDIHYNRDGSADVIADDGAKQHVAAADQPTMDAAIAAFLAAHPAPAAKSGE